MSELDAYMEMPVQCMYCPRVLDMIKEAAADRREAEVCGQSTLDNPELSDPDTLIEALDQRMTKLLETSEDEAFVQSYINVQAKLASWGNCTGASTECGISIRKQS